MNGEEIEKVVWASRQILDEFDRHLSAARVRHQRRYQQEFPIESFGGIVLFVSCSPSRLADALATYIQDRKRLARLVARDGCSLSLVGLSAEEIEPLIADDCDLVIEEEMSSTGTCT